MDICVYACMSDKSDSRQLFRKVQENASSAAVCDPDSLGVCLLFRHRTREPALWAGSLKCVSRRTRAVAAALAQPAKSSRWVKFTAF